MNDGDILNIILNEIRELRKEVNSENKNIWDHINETKTGWETKFSDLKEKVEGLTSFKIYLTAVASILLVLIGPVIKFWDVIARWMKLI